MHEEDKPLNSENSNNDLKPELPPEEFLKGGWLRYLTPIEKHKRAKRSHFWSSDSMGKVFKRFSAPMLIAYGFLAIVVISGAFESWLEPWWVKAMILALCAAINLGPIIWWWNVTTRFEDWMSIPPFKDQAQMDFEKKRFETNSKHAMAMWAALASLFLGVVIKLAVS